MRKLICAVLMLTAAQAQARQFLVPTEDGKTKAITVQPKLAGVVDWLDKPMEAARPRGAGSVEIHAMSEVKTFVGIGFDDVGTAYLLQKESSKDMSALRISYVGAGNEGNFEFHDWPYAIFNGELVGIDDGLFISLFNKVKPPPSKKGLRLMKEGGGVGAGVGVVAGLIGGVASGAGLAILGGAAYYGYQVRRQFFSSHADLENDNNWFRKVILKNVIHYEILRRGNHPTGEVEDVQLTVQTTKNGPKEYVLMSTLAMQGKLDYRSQSCVSFFTQGGPP